MRPTTSAQEASSRPLVFEIVERVASAKGVTNEDLTPLAEVVDFDALSELAETLDSNGEIMFEYEGFAVTVKSDDCVRLSRLS